MTDHDEHRRDIGETEGKKRKGPSKITKSDNKVKPSKLDIQASFCFEENPVAFPEPIQTNPLIFGKAGLMFHVNKSSGLGLELPGRGVVIELDNGGELVRRSFTLRDRSGKGEDRRVKYLGPLNHSIICWHKFKDTAAVTDSFVICYGHPELERINLPVVSMPPIVASSALPRVSGQYRSVSIEPVESSSSHCPQGRIGQSSASAFEDHIRSEDTLDHTIRTHFLEGFQTSTARPS